MPKFVIEFIDAIDVAWSEYTGEGAGEKANGPVIDLFLELARQTCAAGCGDRVFDRKAYDAWLFATQFHLPPNTRRPGVRRAPPDSFGPARDYEFWLSFGKRVRIPRTSKTKRVTPGLFATLNVYFKGRQLFDATAMKEGGEQLIALVKACEIEPRRGPYIEEHLQKPNEGGWAGMKLMLPIEGESLPAGMRNNFRYTMPDKPG